MNDYSRVSCELHDCLEEIATLKCQCIIIYRNHSNQFTKVRGQIVEIYAADNRDWCKLGDGTVISLDKIEEFES